jgi:pyruvate/2-oxoglutarate/acetoin dehydrogenase E1 component
MREITFNEAIREALREEMRRDSNVYIVGEDVGVNARNKLSATLLQEFGTDRIIDTPIAESVIIGSSVGAALAGMRPVVDIGWTDFMLDGMDALITQASRARYSSDGEAKVPMVIRAGYAFGLEAMMHLEAWFMHTPGLKVVIPSNPHDAKGLLKSAIRDDNPVIFLEHGSFGNQLKGPVPEGEYTVPIGLAEIKRKGTDITVVATGKMVHEALAAAEELVKESISLEVVDLRTVAPMDKATILESVKKTGRLIVAHEAVKTGGMGAEIGATVAEEAFSSLKAPIARVAAFDVPPPFNRGLRNMTLPTKLDIIDAAKNIMQSKSWHR